jgi:hypothetical protein
LTAVPDAFEKARRAVEGRFEVFASTPDSVSFRWRHAPGIAGPDFRLDASDRASTTRSMRAWQRRAIAKHAPPFASFLALSFDDLDRVLDEANGLIEAQSVIGRTCRGPMFLAWNKKLISPAGDELSVFDPLA